MRTKQGLLCRGCLQSMSRTCVIIIMDVRGCGCGCACACARACVRMRVRACAKVFKKKTERQKIMIEYIGMEVSGRWDGCVTMYMMYLSVSVYCRCMWFITTRRMRASA